jgi:hypothetical protein
MHMRRAEHAEAFRLHFQRLTLASLVRSAEAIEEEQLRKGRRRRAERAAREAARLRALAASLGPQPRTPRAEGWLPGAAALHDRIGAYVGDVAELPLDRRPPAESDAAPPVSAARGAPPGSRRVRALLGACWLACGAALAVSLLRTGIDSSVSEALDWTIMPTTIAAFLAFTLAGEA